MSTISSMEDDVRSVLVRDTLINVIRSQDIALTAGYKILLSALIASLDMR